jgi:hypothetical protein
VSKLVNRVRSSRRLAGEVEVDGDVLIEDDDRAGEAVAAVDIAAAVVIDEGMKWSRLYLAGEGAVAPAAEEDVGGAHEVAAGTYKRLSLLFSGGRCRG